MPISDGRNKRSASEPNTPAMDALMNAIYYLGCRQRYDERIGKNDEFTMGGAAGVIAYLEQTVDISRPIAAYMDDVLQAVHAVQAEARTQMDGVLW